MSTIVSALLWLLAIGTGLMAGVYFAFSTFVMTALGSVPQAAGIAAMQSIDRVIYQSLFMPLFLGTTLASVLLVVLALLRWAEAGSGLMVAAGVVYVVGMFACTMFFNVPLNTSLASVEPSSAESAAVWARYLREWTLWNHVRTVASAASAALYIAAIAVRWPA